MNETTRAKAIAALEGMREIVRREMLTQGIYVDPEVSNPRLVGAICGGRKHCAIGSLWVGGGIKATKEKYGIALPGTAADERPDFLRHRPGLRAAYDSLNLAAEEFATKHELDLSVNGYKASIESLFEEYYGEELTKRDLLKIISAAKRKVKEAV